MSLADKWEEYRITQEHKFTDGGPIEKLFEQALQRAFYAGAQSALKETGDGTYFEIQAEIDHFRSHK